MAIAASTSALGAGRSDMAHAVDAKRGRASAEAARYGVLRRLGPALKHDMVVNLQAIAMMSEVMNAKLDRGPPEPNEFHASIAKLNRLARDAVANCLKVAEWLEPVEDQSVVLADGVEECLQLLASNFNFRGFLVSRQLSGASFQVSRIVLRHLLIGSLITLTDAAGGPCEVTVKAEVTGGAAEITVRIAPRQDGFDALPYEPSYRQLDWTDVLALAHAEGVELSRGADHITMRMSRAVATAPLQIAPH